MTAPDAPAPRERPYAKCAFCGEGINCEHGICEMCGRCRKCRRLDEVWEDLGHELRRMGDEEPTR